MTGAFKNDQASAAERSNQSKKERAVGKLHHHEVNTNNMEKTFKLLFPKLISVPHSALGIYDTPTLREVGAGLVHE